MRFDYRGMGDSSGPFHDLEEINPDIGAALDAMCRQVPSLRSIALWGLCGGASAALLYWFAERDARVGALALVNPWIRSEMTQARTRVKRYYLQRFAQPAFWRKLLSGGIARDAISELLSNLRQMFAPRPEATPVRGLSDAEIARRMRDGWAAFPGPILLALSGNDFTAQQFLEAAAIDKGWRRNLRMAKVRRVDLVDADHTCTDPAWAEHLERESIACAWSMGCSGDDVVSKGPQSVGNVSAPTFNGLTGRTRWRS